MRTAKKNVEKRSTLTCVSGTFGKHDETKSFASRCLG